MAAYVLVDVRVEDPEVYEAYKQLAPAAVTAYGGRFVVRGGRVVPVEGDWDPERIVVLEFESVERARAWWASEAYTPAKALRQRSASTRMIIVEGV